MKSIQQALVLILLFCQISYQQENQQAEQAASETQQQTPQSQQQIEINEDEFTIKSDFDAPMHCKKQCFEQNKIDKHHYKYCLHKCMEPTCFEEQFQKYQTFGDWEKTTGKTRQFALREFKEKFELYKNCYKKVMIERKLKERAAEL